MVCVCVYLTESYLSILLSVCLSVSTDLLFIVGTKMS